MNQIKMKSDTDKSSLCFPNHDKFLFKNLQCFPLQDMIQNSQLCPYAFHILSSNYPLILSPTMTKHKFLPWKNRIRSNKWVNESHILHGSSLSSENHENSYDQAFTCLVLLQLCSPLFSSVNPTRLFHYASVISPS